jgi:hypothetical protein
MVNNEAQARKLLSDALRERTQLSGWASLQGWLPFGPFGFAAAPFGQQ